MYVCRVRKKEMNNGMDEGRKLNRERHKYVQRGNNNR